MVAKLKRTIRKEKAKINMKLPLTLPPPDSRPFDVVGVGESSVDFLASLSSWPEPDGKSELSGFAIAPGGQMATAMVACARLGWRTRYVGAVGDDEIGVRVAATLAAEGVESVLVPRPGAASRMAVVLVEPQAGRRTVLFRRDAALGLEDTDVAAEVLRSGRILMLDATDPRMTLRAAAVARSAGIPTMIDIERWSPEMAPIVRQIDVVIAPAAFFRAFAGGDEPEAALARFEERVGPAVVVATLGERGSVARCRGHVIRTAALRVPVVDPTGAGDAFRGGFASGWLRLGSDAELEDVLDYANRVAGLNCRALGAQTALPSTADLENSV